MFSHIYKAKPLLRIQIRNLTLKTVETPSENALKFIVLDKKFLPEGITQAIEIDNIGEAEERSPIARELYKINGVKSMLIGSDFITVNKVDNSLSNNPELDWSHLKPIILDTINSNVDKKTMVINASYLEKFQEELDALNESDDDIVYEIKELINTRIRPALQDDGGDIHFRSFDESNGIVYVKLKGACKSCSLSEDTLKGGIEGMLKHYVPEVEEVRSVLDPEEEVAIAEFEKLEKKLKEGRSSSSS